MEHRTTRFLTASLILASIFCVIVFQVQTMWMNRMGADAIKEIGIIYMSGMSRQVAAHFGTTIELRLSQVEALVDAVSPTRNRNSKAVRVELAHSARSRGFEYLAFYTEDGDFHMIYGSKVKPEMPQALHESVMGGRDNVSVGRDEHGQRVALIGVPAVYEIEDGRKSAALVAGLPVSYFRDTLSVNIDSSMIDYSIIRRDGTFILQNADDESGNYFENASRNEQKYVEELRATMESGEDYTSEVEIEGERWNLYCTMLPASEWYLLLYMPHNTLDQTVGKLAGRWSFSALACCALILGALLLVFIGYFRLTRRQMRELNLAYQSAEKERRTAERASRAKSEFLSNMSHDIRTPMNGIMGMTLVAMNNLDNAVRIRMCLKRITVSSRHLLGLINDMLDMAKMENGGFSLNMEPVSLREVMQNIMIVIQPQVQEKEQVFNIYIEDIQFENVCTDRVRLSQILLNMIGNAVKFTPKNGRIQAYLSEEVSPKGEAYVRSCLHIKDNGIGMTQEFLERIFEAFAREDHARVEKSEGAGMGMTITKYIVDAMGGSIRVESELGKGSDFYVTLDMEKIQQGDQELVLPQREVLVVDDDEICCRTAKSMLTSIGLCAECVQDMDSALRVMEEYYSSGKDPIVLLDWDIQGQDDAHALQKMRSRFGEKTTILLLSDGEWDELEEHAGYAGADGFIAKPLFRSGLYYGLRQFAEEKEQEKAEAGDDMDFTGRRVLFAEDNELNWEIGESMLSELGMELDWAENGKICLDKFEQSQDGWYDLILMDLRMPVMTGYEAASAIRSLERDDAKRIPIIAVSADAFEDDVKKCLDCGMNAHAAKPYDLMELIGLMNQYLHP
ncbi:MAG: response regulator [Eubacterium sp.]|nr:response regulator [Eubacterium sp.]